MKNHMIKKCIIFDIDGVLIDTKKSYNETIKKTVQFILQTENVMTHNFVDDELILQFRQTGGFNNDIDTTYAIILLSLAANQLNKEIRQFIEDVIDKIDNTGITSVEKILSKELNLSKIKQTLNYPPTKKEKSIVETIFNEYFYGKDLFFQLYKEYPKHYQEKALIENDRLLINEITLNFLKNHFDNRIAILSGRSKLAAEYSLRKVLSWFNISASFFLEDELREHAKPNPYFLLKIGSLMGTDMIYYVGDSIEDLLMAKFAKENEIDIQFIGVYGHSSNPLKTKQLFMKNKADFLVKDVNDLPNIFNNEVKK